MNRWMCLIGVLLNALSWAAEPAVDGWTLEANTRRALVREGAADVPLPCRAEVVSQDVEFVYVACSDRVLWYPQTDGVLGKPKVFPVAVVDEPMAEVSQAVTSKGRRMMIALGREDGLKHGDYVEFFKDEVKQLAGEELRFERRVAVARVVELAESAAEIELAVDRVVPPDAYVRATEDRPVRDFLAPPRIGRRGYGGVQLRSMIGVGYDSSGGSIYSHANVGYRFEMPVALELRMAPATVGFGDRGSILHASFVAYAMFDHELFAVGLGGGANVLTLGKTEGLLAQHLRIGAREGLNGTFWFQFANSAEFREGSNVWVIDDIDGTLQIPLTHRKEAMWLMLRGAGGVRGGFGEIGVRLRVKDDARGRNLALTPLLGAGTINEQRTFYVGPTVGLGVDASF